MRKRILIFFALMGLCTTAVNALELSKEMKEPREEIQVRRGIPPLVIPPHHK